MYLCSLFNLRDSYDQLTDVQRLELSEKLLHESGEGKFMLSSIEPLRELLKEYQNNPIFYLKVRWLIDNSAYDGIRRLKGDGNCFYRAFGYAIVHALYQSQDICTRQSFLQHLGTVFDLLKQVGFDDDISHDFYEPLGALLESAKDFMSCSRFPEAKVVKTFNDPEKSNSIVAFLRLVTSAFLQVRFY